MKHFYGLLRLTLISNFPPKCRYKAAVSTIRRAVVIIAIIALAPSCASITRGTTEAYAIQTIPSGAKVDVTHTGGQGSCNTPCSIQVKRKGLLVIEIIKEGYEQFRTTIASSIDTAGGTAMAGNILIGGLIGAGIDASTGAMHSHEPNPLEVTLEKMEGN